MFLRIMIFIPLLKLALLLDTEETDDWRVLDDYPVDGGPSESMVRQLRHTAITLAHELPLERSTKHKIRPVNWPWWKSNVTIRVWQLDGLTWLDADGRLYYQAGHLFHGVYLEPLKLWHLNRRRVNELQAAISSFGCIAA